MRLTDEQIRDTLAEEKGYAMKKAIRAGVCPICHARIIGWTRTGVSARLVRQRAMADHVKVLHPEQEG